MRGKQLNDYFDIHFTKESFHIFRRDNTLHLFHQHILFNGFSLTSEQMKVFYILGLQFIGEQLHFIFEEPFEVLQTLLPLILLIKLFFLLEQLFPLLGTLLVISLYQLDNSLQKLVSTDSISWIFLRGGE